jgi:hypothetical protein
MRLHGHCPSTCLRAPTNTRTHALLAPSSSRSSHWRSAFPATREHVVRATHMRSGAPSHSARLATLAAKALIGTWPATRRRRKRHSLSRANTERCHTSPVTPPTMLQCGRRSQPSHSVSALVRSWVSIPVCWPSSGGPRLSHAARPIPDHLHTHNSIWLGSSLSRTRARGYRNPLIHPHSST